MKAFPSDKSTENPNIVNNIEEGMDLRDYFAAKAMQGLLSNQEETGTTFDKVVEWSYSIADQMMEARK